MKFDLIKCYELFAAIQYKPFIEKIILEKEKFPNIRDTYKEVLPAIGSMFEFKSQLELLEKDNSFKIRIPIDDKNYLKLNYERVEIQQILDKKINEIAVYERLKAAHNLYLKLFNNKAIKFGLIKFYDIEYSSDILHKIFKFNKEFENELDNIKYFTLLKRNNFNINIEYYFNKKTGLKLRIDINDIAHKDVFYEWDHFDEILKIHQEVINNDIYKIVGLNHE